MLLAILAGLSIILVGISLATANSTFIIVSIIFWIIIMGLSFILKNILK